MFMTTELNDIKGKILLHNIHIHRNTTYSSYECIMDTKM